MKLTNFGRRWQKKNARIASLGVELQSTKDELQSTANKLQKEIDWLQSQNQELKSQVDTLKADKEFLDAEKQARSHDKDSDHPNCRIVSQQPIYSMSAYCTKAAINLLIYDQIGNLGFRTSESL